MLIKPTPRKRVGVRCLSFETWSYGFPADPEFSELETVSCPMWA